MSVQQVNFTVYGVAAPAGSKTSGVSKAGQRFVRDSNPRSGHWKMEVANAAGKEMEKQALGLMEGPLSLVLNFYRPRPKSHYGAKLKVKESAPGYPIGRPDSTKLTRAVEDAMTGIVYRDDSQIVFQEITKSWGEPARVEVSVSVLEDCQRDNSPTGKSLMDPRRGNSPRGDESQEVTVSSVRDDL